MLDWMREKVLLWTTTAAATMTVLQMVTPSWLDWLFDIIVVGLVYAAASLAKMGDKKK